MLETTAPILPARDFDETSAFYAALGFKETGRWTGHGYMIIATEKVELHFFEHKDLDITTNFAAAYIRSSQVDAFAAALDQLRLPSEGIPRLHPVEDKSWGMRELSIIDPNGTLLRIGQFLDG